MTGPYLDTSALAKWYLNEPFSEEFEAFIREQPTAAQLFLSLHLIFALHNVPDLSKLASEVVALIKGIRQNDLGQECRCR